MDGICFWSMVWDIDFMIIVLLKLLNDDFFLYCNGVVFVNELNDGGNDKFGMLKDDSSEKLILMKNFYDLGCSFVYRVIVNKIYNEVC